MRISLSPRERAGVRGKRAFVRHRIGVWGLTPGEHLGPGKATQGHLKALVIAHIFY